MHALIDGDLIVYRAGFGAQSKTTEIPVTHSLHNAKSLLSTYVNQLKTYFDIDKVSIYLTSDDKSNFRFEVAKTQEYKGNRKQPKPVHYSEIREYMENKYKAIMVHGEEADDAIGKESTRLRDKCVIVSADKDMRMLPGWHWEMGDRLPYYSTEHGHLQLERRAGKRSQLFGTGDMWFYAQCLLGDKADNIPGVKGFGDVKTFHTLNRCKTKAELLNKVIEVYKDNGLSEEQLTEVETLLWIRR